MSKFYPPKTHTAYRESKVPKQGELLYDIDQNVLYVGDGVTAGGIPVMVNGGTGSLTGGFHIEVQGGTVSQKRFNSIETLLSGGTIYAGHSYKLNATSVSGTTIYAEDFDRGLTGLDATVEIMINGTGYLHVAGNLTIKGALEPDAMNNCVVRFHDGDAVLEVLDNTGGYIVTTASGSTVGTLVYALTNTGDDASPYITISSELNGTPLDLAGTTVTTERHVVGNGYEETILGGTISIEGGTAGSLSFAALGLGNTTVASGTLTLGDVYIPSGATVSVSGGGLAVEKVTGAGETSVIDLGGTNVVISSGGTAYASGCTFSGGLYSSTGGAFAMNNNPATLLLNNVIITSNTAKRGGGFATAAYSIVNISNSVISGNTATDNIGNDIYILGLSATVNVTGSTVGDAIMTGGTMTLVGDCHIDSIRKSLSYSGTVIISSGASINLASSIDPGGTGGITVLTGGCTVNGNVIPDGTYTNIDSTGTPT